MAGEPIEGQILLLAATKASVPPERLPDLVERVQVALEADLERYRHTYERVYEEDGIEVFLVDRDQWDNVGDQLGFSDRELSAVKRAHAEQLLRVGRTADRETEFEAALEIREPLLVGTDGE